MKEFTLGLLYLILAFIASVAIIAVIYAIYGAVIYFGLALLGFEITYPQAFVSALLINVVGMIRRGGTSVSTRKQAKEDDALSE
jgi:hypothetical protein